MVGCLLFLVGFIGVIMFFWEILLLMIGSFSFRWSFLFLSIILFIGSIAIAIWYDEKKHGEERARKAKLFADEYEKNNIDENNAKVCVGENPKLLYLNDNRLFYINKTEKILYQIHLDKILKIETTVAVQEKTKKEILTLTPTFFTQQTILNYGIKIITETETTVLTFAPYYENKEFLERFKLILERDMKNLKESNENI